MTRVFTTCVNYSELLIPDKICILMRFLENGVIAVLVLQSGKQRSLLYHPISLGGI